ncbi:HU family DNA-binding protein [Methylobacterium longum]|uniref:HU family DNA-binding protein n=1 Tax=Methylobacterium longum TaxID=767694 RepID=A0ABT8AHQ7_9HYPH|nr:HU family DNA-binding protein [Methylobacterium longum]MDN3569295.1 HU family DNA-binding protein [Methylobacterium longum]
MIQSELVTRLAAQNPHLLTKEAEAVPDTILEGIAEALAVGDRIELRDFGTFSIRDRDARTEFDAAFDVLSGPEESAGRADWDDPKERVIVL